LFIIVQFPLADLRALTLDAMGRLAIPDWNADDPGERFVRGFGEVYPRNSGGMERLHGERAFADFNQAARYRATIEYHQSDWPKPLRITPWFRRFYFDGVLAGRFEFGFHVPDQAEYEVFVAGARNGYDIVEVARTIAGVPLLVRGLDLPPEELVLEQAGDALGRAYLVATTRRDALMTFPVSETYGRHVAVGPLVVLIRVSDCRPVIVGRSRRRIEVEEGSELFVTSCKTGHGRFGIIAQTSVMGALFETSPERAVRVLFGHLNAVIFAASHAARADLGETGQAGRDRIADLLDRTMRRLQDLSESADENDEEYAAALRAFGRAHAGRLDDLFATIERQSEVLRKPATSKGLIAYGKSLLDTILKKAVEVGVEKALKPGG
jgi:hypothetical protein